MYSKTHLLQQKNEALAAVQASIGQVVQRLAAKTPSPISTGDHDGNASPEEPLDVADGSLMSRERRSENIEMMDVSSDRSEETHTSPRDDVQARFDDVAQIESVSLGRRGSYRRLSGEFYRGKVRTSFGSRLSPSLGALSSLAERDDRLVQSSVVRSRSDSAIAESAGRSFMHRGMPWSSVVCCCFCFCCCCCCCCCCCPYCCKSSSSFCFDFFCFLKGCLLVSCHLQSYSVP